MPSQQLIAAAKLAVVELTKGEWRARLGLWLAEPFAGGEIVRLAPGAAVAVEAADALAATYGRANWLSGPASGAFYAFRALCIPRQCVVLTEFSGRLSTSDMEAVASSTAIGIARLAAMELPTLPIEGWTVEATVASRVAGSEVLATGEDTRLAAETGGVVDGQRVDGRHTDASTATPLPK